ncbi:Putative periplasmic protein [hydrothermal vent metagenome]|uniref:Putative periplasmic protein n=1 Tax=hydrothermal vent metagenome TaxID=652676 RepID=A0A1W1C615_9ZZZZ
MTRKIFSFLLFSLSLFGASFLTSNIPLPKTYILDLEPYPCNEKCLQNYIKHERIFSFLAKATKRSFNSSELQDARNIYISVFNLGSMVITKDLKIAMLLPYKNIGKYATTTTQSVFTYLLTRNNNFELKSFSIDNESKEEIQKALDEIKKEGFYYVIAPMTLTGAQNIIALDPQLRIYFPTINKNDCNTSSEDLYFGAIDYKAQSKALLKEATSPLVIFYDNSSIGRKLSTLQENLYLNKTLDIDTMLFEQNESAQEEKRVIKYAIASRTTNLERELKKNSKLEGASIMLDTPLVKSGMIMSQLTLYDINITNTLSTQINYDPLLLSITQYEDRKKMIIANSITKENKVLTQTNALLENDIKYDWINYTTTIGIDYFFSLITKQPREYDIPIVENQMIYPIELIQPSYARFVKYYPISEESELLH